MEVSSRNIERSTIQKACIQRCDSTLSVGLNVTAAFAHFGLKDEFLLNVVLVKLFGHEPGLYKTR